MITKTIYLRSGKWRCYGPPGADELELVDPARPTNKMRVPIAPGAAGLPDNMLEDVARRPEVRLWTDEHGISWRVSAIGPGTRFPLVIQGRHLLFDSEQAWAGIVPFEAEEELGDLTDTELRRLRDRMSDVGARRRAFRAPGSGPGGTLEKAATPPGGSSAPDAPRGPRLVPDETDDAADGAPDAPDDPPEAGSPDGPTTTLELP